MVNNNDRANAAKEAMLRRSREKAKPSTKNQYYAVIAFFCLCMLGALIYTLTDPKKSFSQMPVIDDSAMMLHNGQNHRFSQGPNEFFNVSHTNLTC